MRSARPLVVLAGLAVSALFAYLAVREVELGIFWRALRESNYLWVLPALALLAVTVAIKAWRWRLLFPTGTRPAFAPTARALLVGYFFNNIFPARAGEAIRVLYLHREAGTSRAEAVATAISERVYDVLALLVLLFAAAPFLPEVSRLRTAAWLAAGLAALVLGAFAVFARWGDRPLRILVRPLARLPRMDAERAEFAAGSLMRGLSGLHSPRLALRAFALTVASWLVLALSFWALMPAFGLDTGFASALLVVVALNLALILPSSAAAIGVFEAAVVVALAAFDVPRADALAYAVVLHVVNFVPFVVAGALLVPRGALALRRAATEAPPDEPGAHAPTTRGGSPPGSRSAAR